VAHEPAHGGTQRAEPRDDRALAALATAQHGPVSTSQLRALGLGASGARSRVARGRLHRRHRGVYAVGHGALTPDGHRSAAVLACGPEAALSHASAAELWNVGRSAATRYDVTVPTHRRSRPLIRVHHAPLPAAHVTVVRGIRVTTLARTLLDCADVLRPDALRRMVEAADRERLLDVRAVQAVLATANGRRGAGALRGLLGEQLAGIEFTRSELEVAFLRACADHGLPAPVVNARVAGVEVDALFAGARLVVELDSYAFHRTRAELQRDHDRDLTLRLEGFDVIRLTHRHVVREPAATAAALRALLARGRSV
jgi:hypothetical protein